MQSVRYGGGVWKHHEETRLRLEAQVRAHEAQLDVQRHALTLAQRSNAGKTQQIEELQTRLYSLDRIFSEKDQSLDVAHAQLASSAMQICEYEQHLAQARANEQALQQQLQEKDAARSQLEQSMASLHAQCSMHSEECARLGAMLFDAQELSEWQQLELEKRQWEIDIQTRALQAKDRQFMRVQREKQELAQKLAQVRLAGSSLQARVTPMTCLKQQPKAQVVAPPSAASSNQDEDEASHTTTRQQNGLAMMRRVVQATNAKLQHQQQQNEELQSQVHQLESDYRALLLRFREASTARRCMERKQSSTKSV